MCPVKVLLTLYRCTDRLRPRLLALSVRIVRTSPLCVLLHGTRVTSLCLPLARDAVGAPPLADAVPLATTPLPHTHGTHVRSCTVRYVAVDAAAVATIFPPKAMATLLLGSIREVLLSMRLLVDRIIVQFWPNADRGSSVASEVRVCLMASRVLLMTCCSLTLSCRNELLTKCRRGLSTARGRARSGWPVHFLTS